MEIVCIDDQIKKALKTVGLSVLQCFFFHDVYNYLNNRYDAEAEIEKLEKMV